MLSVLLSAWLSGCTRSLSQAFQACQSGVSSANVHVEGRRLAWSVGSSKEPRSYVGRWIDAKPQDRYVLTADMGREEPLKGVGLRIEDRNHVIHRDALKANCADGSCLTRNVTFRGRLIFEQTSYEGAYSGIFIPDK